MPEKTSWIPVSERLPEDRTLTWIHVVYEPSPYDNVTERISIGFCCDGVWFDALDAPFADDFTVTHWMPLDFPKFRSDSE